MSYYDYRFEGEIVNHDVGYIYTVIFLPDAIAKELPFKQHPRLRIEGEVAEQPFEGAWQPVRGRWYIMLSKDLLKAAGIGLGDTVEVRFSVTDQDAVDVPGELKRALAGDDAAEKAWARLTPGKQRGFAYHVASAKTEKTRSKRLRQVIEGLKVGKSLREL